MTSFKERPTGFGTLAMLLAILRTSSPVSGLGQCPLYPRKQTWFGTFVMSALCQKQTSLCYRGSIRMHYREYK